MPQPVIMEYVLPIMKAPLIAGSGSQMSPKLGNPFGDHLSVRQEIDSVPQSCGTQCDPLPPKFQSRSPTATSSRSTATSPQGRSTRSSTHLSHTGGRSCAPNGWRERPARPPTYCRSSGTVAPARSTGGWSTVGHRPGSRGPRGWSQSPMTSPGSTNSSTRTAAPTTTPKPSSSDGRQQRPETSRCERSPSPLGLPSAIVDR